jgi:hypothetical protein
MLDGIATRDTVKAGIRKGKLLQVSQYELDAETLQSLTRTEQHFDREIAGSNRRIRVGISSQMPSQLTGSTTCVKDPLCTSQIKHPIVKPSFAQRHMQRQNAQRLQCRTTGSRIDLSHGRVIDHAVMIAK